MTDPSLGIIAALVAEAGTLPAGAPARLVVSGPGPERAAAAAECLVREGCVALLSWGVAAGLDPDLGPGAVIVADTVHVPGDAAPLRGDIGWQGAVLARCHSLEDVHAGAIVGVSDVLDTAAGKRALEGLGAVADMESAAIARVAIERGAAWLAVRAVVDPAHVDVPPAALAGLRADGRTAPWQVVRALISSPLGVGAVIGLGLRFARARAGLRAVASAAGPALTAPTAAAGGPPAA